MSTKNNPDLDPAAAENNGQNTNKKKKIKLPTLADAGQTLGAADAFLESLPDAAKAFSSPSSAASELAFGSCHLPPRLLASSFPSGPMRGEAAAQLLRDFRALDSRPSLNVASFVTTQVEPECQQLMAEALTINYIDEEEYPSTAQIQQQCVAQLGDLLSAEKDEGKDGESGKHCGTSTVGSSEAILLCYLAMKRRWQESRRAAGLPVEGVKCSVVSCFVFYLFFSLLSLSLSVSLLSQRNGVKVGGNNNSKRKKKKKKRSTPPATMSATKKHATISKLRCASPRSRKTATGVSPRT